MWLPTVVFAFDEGLPLPEPLHANAQDDRGSLLGLKLLVQLQVRGQSRLVSIPQQRSNHQMQLLGQLSPTLMKVSISVLRRLARASISTWQMAHM